MKQEREKIATPGTQNEHSQGKDYWLSPETLEIVDLDINPFGYTIS